MPRPGGWESPCGGSLAARSRTELGTSLAYHSRVPAASREDLGTWIRFPLAPEVIGLRGLQEPHLSRKVTGRSGGLLGPDGLQHPVIVAVPAVVGVVGRGQDVQEGGWPVHSVDLVQVVPVWRKDTGATGLGVLGPRAQHAGPHGVPLPGLQRRLELLLWRWSPRPLPACRLQLVHAADANGAVEHLEHAVHARVVVQRDGCAALEQEHAEAEAVRLVNVHVGNRWQVGRQGLQRGLARDDVQVLGADLGQKALQFAQVLREALRHRRLGVWDRAAVGSAAAAPAAPEGEARLTGDPLDQGGHVVSEHARMFPRVPRPAPSFPPPLAVSGGRHGCAQPRARREVPQLPVRRARGTAGAKLSTHAPATAGRVCHTPPPSAHAHAHGPHPALTLWE